MQEWCYGDRQTLASSSKKTAFCVEVDLSDPGHNVRDKLQNKEKQAADTTLEMKETEIPMSINGPCHFTLEYKIKK